MCIIAEFRIVERLLQVIFRLVHFARFIARDTGKVIGAGVPGFLGEHLFPDLARLVVFLGSVKRASLLEQISRIIELVLRAGLRRRLVLPVGLVLLIRLRAGVLHLLKFRVRGIPFAQGLECLGRPLIRFLHRRIALVREPVVLHRVLVLRHLDADFGCREIGIRAPRVLRQNGIFINYSMLSQEDFYDRAKDFSLLKDMEGKYFTYDEYKTLIKDNQTDKDGNLVYLYATNKDEQ